MEAQRAAGELAARQRAEATSAEAAARSSHIRKLCAEFDQIVNAASVAKQRLYTINAEKKDKVAKAKTAKLYYINDQQQVELAQAEVEKANTRLKLATDHAESQKRAFLERMNEANASIQQTNRVFIEARALGIMVEELHAEGALLELEKQDARARAADAAAILQAYKESAAAAPCSQPGSSAQHAAQSPSTTPLPPKKRQRASPEPAAAEPNKSPRGSPTADADMDIEQFIEPVD